MTDPIRPINPTRSVPAVRGVGRRVGATGTALARGDEGAKADPERNLPVPVTTVVAEEPAGEDPSASQTAYAAQMMGQGGQKRGLRGGKETLDRARSTYLETEWSGPNDRRVRAGIITKTEI
ncbi:MAG: hypothetical protein P4L64_12090 [Caulobacteraceae bacterium]|nr:hypothetical protein [Caulobacteraceae bacterium]